MSPSFSDTEYSDKVVHDKHPFPVDKKVVKVESEFRMETHVSIFPRLGMNENYCYAWRSWNTLKA